MLKSQMLETKSWLVVASQAEFGAEHRAANNLARQGYETYLPRCIEPGRTRILPLFPGYLFVRHFPDSNIPWQPIRSTPGVLDVIRFGDAPSRIADTVITEIKAREKTLTGELQGTKVIVLSFMPGDRVHTTDGPFAGLDLIFEADDGERRVWLLLDMLSTSVRFSAARACVRRAR